MRTKARKGQSILEYTLLLGAIIAVLVVVLLGNGGIKGKVTTAYNHTGDALANTTNKMSFGVFGN